MLNVLLASRNAGKLREFAELLPEVHLIPWPMEAPELPETGAFFSVSPSAIRETSCPVLWPSDIPLGFSWAGA